ncbi:MAG: hypothetical protein DMG58_16820 [Acidobacteria bacterium]|nr:MAG: hypothetical protein DMG58_16820 [Acidobacteriota bacterium]
MWLYCRNPVDVIRFALFMGALRRIRRRWFSPAVCVLAGEVTFHQQVVPVLQKHSVSCHRPGEAAPMSLLTYRDARP